MSEKTGQEIKEMLSTENIVLAKSAADVEDVLQGLVEDVTKVCGCGALHKDTWVTCS